MSRADGYVVALLGISGSGKRLVSQRLCEHHGLTRVRFDDPQRDMLKAGFGLTEAEIDGPARGRPVDRLGGFPPKKLIHTLTNDWGRAKVHSALWVNEYLRRVANVRGGVVTDDLYRPEQAEAIRSIGGVIVRVTRPDFKPRHLGSAEDVLRIQADAEIVNDDIDTLSGKADAMITTLQAAIAGMVA